MLRTLNVERRNVERYTLNRVSSHSSAAHLSPARRVVAELRRLGAIVRALPLWLALGAGLFLWPLAYQAASPVRLDIGGDAVSRLRGFDTPFLTGFNDAEPADLPGRPWHAGAPPPYRWATDRAAITLPAAGGDLWVVHVTAASGWPDGRSIASVWRTGAMSATLQIDARPRTYAVLAHADPVGNLQVMLETAPFVAPADPRTLGLVVFRVMAGPAGAAPYRPAPVMLLTLAAAIIGMYVLARRSLPPGRVGDRFALLLALAVVAFGAWMLAARRMDLAVFAPIVTGLLWAAYPLAAMVEAGLRAIQREDGAAAAGLTATAFIARMGGMLHPYALTSDLGLHVNNLADVARGMILFTEGLPCRAGAGPQPYPPGGYLVLLPGVLLGGADREALTLLVRGGTALLESLTTALLWLLLRRVGVSRRAALVSAVLYTLAPPLLRSYSVGEMANLLAQALVAPLLIWLTLATRDGSRCLATASAALLAMILLSHGGVALSTGAALAVWLSLQLWAAQANDGHVRARLAWTHGVAMVAAGILALALFYSAFGYVADARRIAQQELAAQGVICPPGDLLPDKLNWWVAGLVLGAAAPVSPFILAAGAAGAVLIVRSRKADLGGVLAACWIGTLLSLGTLMVSDQPVRWTLFLYPALCLGAGVALALWRRRGRAGIALTITIVAYLLWYGAADGVRQVSEYLR